LWQQSLVPKFHPRFCCLAPQDWRRWRHARHDCCIAPQEVTARNTHHRASYTRVVLTKFFGGVLYIAGIDPKANQIWGMPHAQSDMPAKNLSKIRADKLARLQRVSLKKLQSPAPSTNSNVQGPASLSRHIFVCTHYTTVCV
jgi:hypothetical protein